MSSKAQDLRASLESAGPAAWNAFESALEAEALARHIEVLAGIDAYRRHPWRRDLIPPPSIWTEGTTRLLDYRGAAPGGLPVLAVPSLINRAYILDLTARHSLMRHLAAKGLAPFLLDWDQPGAEEQDFDLTAYVARLGRALDRVAAITGRKPAVLGYCMGGNLSLALACARPADVAALVLLATPWDFHAGRQAHAVLMRAMTEPLNRMIESMGAVPVDLLQAMFTTLAPNQTARRYAAFARLKRQSARARDFVALEDWANDGVPLAGKVARECLTGWYGANQPARGQWCVGGKPVDPAGLKLPVLALVPERDRIVPPQSAQPLADLIPGAQRLMVTGGHVGMLLSARARSEVYNPLAKWLVHSASQ